MIDITKNFLSGNITEKKESLLEINDELLGLEFILLAKGENNLITGKPGHGKSLIAAHLVSQYLFKVDDWFLHSKENIAIVVFDTEQGKGQIIDWYLKNVYKESKNEKIKTYESIKNYKIFSIKDDEDKLISFKQGIDECQNLFGDKHLLIIIDNLTSFVKDPMASNNECLEKINRYRGKNTLITILHENHRTSSNGEPTGHIGSQSQRNAAIHLSIAKLMDSNSFVVSCNKSRFQNCDEMQQLKFSLTVENEIKFFSNCEFINQSNIPKKIPTKDKVLKVIIEICDNTEFTDEERLRKNIVSKLMDLLNLKDGTLYRHIASLEEEGKIFEDDKGYINYLPF